MFEQFRTSIIAGYIEMLNSMVKTKLKAPLEANIGRTFDVSEFRSCQPQYHCLLGVILLILGSQSQPSSPHTLSASFAGNGP
jgi:hypothetical protein